MGRRALESASLVLLLGFAAGCHCCGTECEVTQICCPEVKTEKVEKEGWDVECKQICIPPIHCPFSDPCEIRCGKVIAVKRLKEDKLECGERCLLEYKLIDPCPVPVEADSGSESEPIPTPAPASDS